MTVPTAQAILFYNDVLLRQRASIVLTRLAVAVLTEKGDTRYHYDRVNWASRVLDNPDEQTRRALRAAVAVVPALPEHPTKVTDEMLENTFTTLIDALAGAYDPLPVSSESV